MRKICFITGTRAEYGLLQGLISKIKANSSMQVSIIATGTHLSPEFGETYREIQDDGNFIDKKIEILVSSNSSVGIAKSMGLGLIGFSEAYYDIKPDLIVVLGDRFEMLSAVSAALVASIPVAHIHGGEITQGAYDDSIRHAITKMSHLHFVATKKYRDRVLQMGENPSNVYMVGGMGADNISRTKILSKKKLEKELGIKFTERNLLVTFHAATMDKGNIEYQIDQLLLGLSNFSDVQLIITMPNADNGSRTIIGKIKLFCDENSNAHFFSSLGRVRYLSCMQYVDGVVGNSSSGIIEAPTLKKPTVNIGTRQQGREMAESIINCDVDHKSITEAIKKIYTKEFKKVACRAVNPYGYGGSVDKIEKVLSNCNISKLLIKKFNDIEFQE